MADLCLRRSRLRRRSTVDAVHLQSYKMWTVYILKCSDGSPYTGCTSNFSERLKRHNQGEINYTSTRLPVMVEVTIEFSDKYKAFNFEKYLKSGSGRAFVKRHF